MKEELGMGRVQDLPMEDGRRGSGRMISGPIINVNRPALQGAWQSAIDNGEFEDEDAEAVKGLDDIAGGRLHAIRDPGHANGGVQPLAAGQARRPKKRPSPFPPDHDLQQPVPGFGFGPRFPGAPAAGDHQAQGGKGKQGNHKQPPANMGNKKRQGQQHDIAVHVDKKRRAASVVSSVQSAPSPRQPIVTSYRLPSRAPPGLLSSTPNQPVDISQRLPGVEILYKCMAQLLEPSPLPPAGALVTWCRPPQADEPMLVVLVQMEIRHQYPATHWKSQWSGGPDTVMIKLKEDSGAEVTVGLVFTAQPAADAFLLFSRKLIDQVKSQPKAVPQMPSSAIDSAPATSVGLPKIQITSAPSGSSTAAVVGTAAQKNIHGIQAVKPTAAGSTISADRPSQPQIKAANGVVGEAIKPLQGGQASQLQKKAVASITATAQGSQPARPEGEKPTPHGLFTKQLATVDKIIKPKAEPSKAQAPVDETSNLIFFDLIPTRVDLKPRETMPSYMDDLCGLSMSAQNDVMADQPPGGHGVLASNLLQPAVPSPSVAESTAVVQQDPPLHVPDARKGTNSHETTTLIGGGSADEFFGRCKSIISQTSDILSLGLTDGVSADEGLRRRLLGEISANFKDIDQGQKGHVISMLLRLFDTIMRPNGLRYSAEELEELRSDAALPSGWVCHNVRADLSSRASGRVDERKVPDIADIRKQIERVVAKQAELAQVQAQAVATEQSSAQYEPAPVKQPGTSRWSSIIPESSALKDLVMLVPPANRASTATQTGTPTGVSPQEDTPDPMEALGAVFKDLSLTAVPSALTSSRCPTATAPNNVFKSTNVPINNSNTYVFQSAKMI
ncbi:hypothetical protein MAPG_05563 [Magnaporthiopsis poae ATCC 64411]|uniref:Uncharacterized protein n=1 Tax=Magnaporthiopsis poae (strain ATCC 64411 / 73-15) TaxID=644358 RepID=A0A0C4DZQ7_MAGP6|nr:hypothetical protein MAPG_05563 [Magnaporthiopsis poae ATCC 64411]